MKLKTDRPDWILGSRQLPPHKGKGPADIAYDDHKIAFVVRHARGKTVLDLGCVQHNPENYRSRYWLHKALRGVASHVEGLDIYAEGVRYLRDRGFDVTVGDAQNFSLKRKFDVIVAGDIVEHLENFEGFFRSINAHLAPFGKLLVSTPNPWYWRNIVKACAFGRVSTNPEHTCWLCPETLSQLASRYGMRITEVVFGSRYPRDRFMPIPRGVRHTSFHAAIISETQQECDST